MSGYTVGEIAAWLTLTAVLGFVLGWLAREIQLRATRPARTPARRNEPKAGSGVDVQAGAYPGSAQPLPDGSAPSPEHVIKGKVRSMIYHAPGTPAYDRTMAETWFTSEDDATAAGFRKPKNA